MHSFLITLPTGHTITHVMNSHDEADLPREFDNAIDVQYLDYLY